MSKFEEVFDKAKAQMDDLSISYDADLLEKVAKGLGPALYNKDASTVAATDKGEMETVQKNFVMNKLGITDESKAKEAVEAVAEEMKDAKMKMRVNFYYLLTKKLGKEDIYG